MLNRIKKGVVFVISAPSGAGKTTIMKKLLKDKKLKLKYSVSCTTRHPRKGEKNGRDYFFLSKEKFEKKIKKGDFLEYANVYGHYYGTDRDVVENILNKGYNALIDVDTKGAAKLMKNKKFKANYIFILPPSMRELRKRLSKRKTESKEEFERRIKEASKEIKKAKRYDYCVINKDIKKAVDDVSAIMRACMLKSELFK